MSPLLLHKCPTIELKRPVSDSAPQFHSNFVTVSPRRRPELPPPILFSRENLSDFAIHFLPNRMHFLPPKHHQYVASTLECTFAQV